MNFINLKKIAVASCFIFSTINYGMNFLRPHDSLLRMDYIEKPWHINFFTELGISDSLNFNNDSNRVHILSLYECEQNALAMLKGFDANSLIGQLNIILNAHDDGIRGHLVPRACFKMNYATAFAITRHITDHFMFSLYIPFFSMQLKDVVWTDLTENITEDDMRVKFYLTNELVKNIHVLGNGLDIQSWKRHGVGDILALTHWSTVYPQYKPLLKSIQLNGRIGLSIPSGKRKDEDKIMAMPFGYDGAVGIVCGGGLDARMGRCVKLGFDVELLHLFGNTRERRIKTDPTQTELLLLQKTCAYKDFGLSQRFNLYVQLYHFLYGASLLVGYQYFKHGDDSLSLVTQEFSSEIANTAKTLHEWTMHHMVIQAQYNFQSIMSNDNIIPQIALFSRLPFNGKLCAVVPVIGAQLSISF
jgi:hypothetical protein